MIFRDRFNNFHEDQVFHIIQFNRAAEPQVVREVGALIRAVRSAIIAAIGNRKLISSDRAYRRASGIVRQNVNGDFWCLALTDAVRRPPAECERKGRRCPVTVPRCDFPYPTLPHGIRRSGGKFGDGDDGGRGAAGGRL